MQKKSPVSPFLVRAPKRKITCQMIYLSPLRFAGSLLYTKKDHMTFRNLQKGGSTSVDFLWSTYVQKVVRFWGESLRKDIFWWLFTYKKRFTVQQGFLKGSLDVRRYSWGSLWYENSHDSWVRGTLKRRAKGQIIIRKAFTWKNSQNSDRFS